MAKSSDLKSPTVDEIQTAVSTSTSGITTSFRLVVAEGPDTGLSFSLDASGPPRVLLGQSEVCEIRLGDREVSRRHAALELQPNGLRVVDLGSRNGTFVDRIRIADATLVGGEVIRVGATSLQVFGQAAPKPALGRTPNFGGVVGFSTPMRRLFPLLVRVAKANVTVLIEGETGTGKEVLAESLHEASPRAGGPFVVFDCAAAPPGIVESELFGHEKGAFTGAVGQRKGVFEQAHGGTLLIDEIGELDLHLQPKLLRAIERLEVRRVGGDRWIQVDVRVIAATRRDLDREVAAGRFRDDLFHRLAVARVELPPLRERKGDVELLAHHFCSELGGTEQQLSADIIRRWDDYAWPGNVRELRNAVARLLALGDPDVVRRTESAAAALASSAGSPDDAIERLLALDLPYAIARDRIVEEFEKRFVERLLAVHGEVAKAASASGIGKRYFQKIRARSRGA